MKKLVFEMMKGMVWCAAFLPVNVMAQDSLTPLREFLQVSSAYRHVPLYLEVEMKNTTNFITSEEDTLGTFGKFYLLRSASYMQLGEIEQFITDSVAMLISSRVQRIIISTNAKPLRDQLKAFSGSLLSDSSLVALSKNFKGKMMAGRGGYIVQLNSFTTVHENSLPKQTVEIMYDSRTKRPLRTTITKRTLIPLDEESFQSLKSQSGFEKFLFSVNDKQYFLIKEMSTSFIYKKATQDPTLSLPVNLSDRIIRNNRGEFEPAKAYENYEITIN
jgi:hypothetical protein